LRDLYWIEPQPVPTAQPSRNARSRKRVRSLNDKLPIARPPRPASSR
jgi:hypothetical protein